MVLTDVGFSCIRNWMIGTTPSTRPTVMPYGCGSAIPQFTNTTLGSKIILSSIPFDSTTTMTNRLEWERVLGSSEGSGLDIAEAGIFNTGSNMFWRDTFIPITQTGSIEIQNTVSVRFV